MPQPLRKPCDWTVGVTAINARPDLAVKMTHIITQWAMLESMYGVILAMMAGKDAETAMVMNEAVIGTAASDAMMRAVAERRLSKPLQDQLSNSLRDTRKRAKDRNTIAHGLWGYSAEHPDGLLHFHPRIMGRFLLPGMLARLRGETPFVPKDEDKIYDAMLWVKRDFDEVTKRIMAHMDDLTNLVGAVAKELGHSSPDAPQKS